MQVNNYISFPCTFLIIYILTICLDIRYFPLIILFKGQKQTSPILCRMYTQHTLIHRYYKCCNFTNIRRYLISFYEGLTSAGFVLFLYLHACYDKVRTAVKQTRSSYLASTHITVTPPTWYGIVLTYWEIGWVLSSHKLSFNYHCRDVSWGVRLAQVQAVTLFLSATVNTLQQNCFQPTFN